MSFCSPKTGFIFRIHISTFSCGTKCYHQTVPLGNSVRVCVCVCGQIKHVHLCVNSMFWFLCSSGASQLKLTVYHRRLPCVASKSQHARLKLFVKQSQEGHTCGFMLSLVHKKPGNTHKYIYSIF